MLVNENVIRAYLDSQYGGSYKENDKEFFIRSPFFPKDRQNKLYISKKDGKWIDFLGAGNKQYQGRFDKFVAMFENIHIGNARKKLVELCMVHGMDLSMDFAKSDVVVPVAHKIPVPMPDGLIPAWNFPVSRGYLIGRGITEEVANLYEIKYNRANCTVLIPFLRNGKPVYHMERYINRNIKQRWRNADVSGEEYFGKSDLFFGEHTITSVEDIVFITEGAFDSMRITQFGFQSMAMCGSSLSENQVDFLKINNFKKVALALDFDEPGIRATYNVADILSSCTDSTVMFNHSSKLLSTVEELGKKDWGELSQDVFHTYLVGLGKYNPLSRVEHAISLT